MIRNGILLALAGSAALLAATAAEAQISSAQQSALRSNCRSDFMSHCSGVTPGGKDALVCLQKNVDALSSACQTVVRSTLPPPAPAAKAEPAPPPAPAPTVVAAPPPPAAPAPAAVVATPAPAAPKPPKVKAVAVATAAPTPEQQSAMRAACRNDFMARCAGVQPGGKDALVCLQRNVSALSPSCKSVVAATMGTPAAAKPVAVATAAPTPEQQSAMRAACRNDFMARCAGVQPGGKDALVCLQRNVATLSPSCKSVVAATMGAPGAAPAEAVAVAPAGGPPPEKLKALKFTCRGDFRRLCKNVPEGPEAFACLQSHAARLSPNCATSVADIAASMPAGGAMPPATAVAVKPAPVPHPPKAPLIDMAVMIRACKLDMIRHCRGAGLGGGQMLACLTAHEADLTFRCRTAMKVSAPLH